MNTDEPWFGPHVAMLWVLAFYLAIFDAVILLFPPA